MGNNPGRRQGGKHCVISRVDLLEALADPSVSRQTVAKIAAALGLKEQVDAGSPPVSPARETGAGKVVVNPLVHPVARPCAALWAATTFAHESPSRLPEATLKSRAVAWRNRPTEKPCFHPLAPARSLLARLDRLIRPECSSREMDVEAMVRKVEMGEPPVRVPRLRIKKQARHLCLINDLHTHLVPYWTDHWLAINLLGSLLAEYRCSRARLLDGQSMPWLESEDGKPTDWRLPPPGSVVLVFSDLGALSFNPQQQVRTWLNIGASCARHDCRLVACIPCHPHDCDPRLRSLFVMEPWESLRHVHRQSLADRITQAEYLLKLLSPAIRIEPGLLRAVRRSMARFDRPMDASIEAVAWQHPAIREPSSVAATPDAGQRRTWLQEFARDDGPCSEERGMVLSLIRSWRSHLSHHVWFEELAGLPAQARSLVPPQDLADMERFFASLVVRMRDGAWRRREVDIRMWLERLVERLPESVKQEEQLGLRELRLLLGRDRSQDRTAYPLDPAKLPPMDQPEQTGLVFLQGEELFFAPYGGEYARPVCYSPLALVNYKRPLVYTEVGERHSGRDVQALQFQSGEFRGPLRIRTMPEHGILHLVTDMVTVRLRRIRRPGWAVNFGQDRYGMFADLQIKGILHRCRWIPPGTFLMGSPEDEPERDNDEMLHQVTLTRGFWLGETTVTQELWTAVMGENPSGFPGKERPVEQVSWQDCQEFFRRLQGLAETGGVTFNLPTEAQWEYACRAGTTTPFSFGDNITPEQVNYDGDFPYNNGKKGEYREETVPVKSLPCNDWGLYEMHGNVWEWCADRYGEYPEGPLEDPARADEAGARVLRGGSWFLSGRFCRSACRLRLVPGNRFHSIGFRLSPGQSAR